jgi:hypothetical protein
VRHPAYRALRILPVHGDRYATHALCYPEIQVTIARWGLTSRHELNNISQRFPHFSAFSALAGCALLPARAGPDFDLAGAADLGLAGFHGVILRLGL